MPSRRHFIVSALAAAVAVLAATVYAATGSDSGDLVPSRTSRPAAPPPPAKEVGAGHHFDVERFAEGFNRPTYVGTAPGDRAGIWVLEQSGRVVRLVDGRRRTVLDLRARVRTGAEQGLLGIAFHPDFAANRRLYLHWSDPKGDTRVAEFRVRADFSIDSRPVRRLLHVRQPEENHNGGQLAFGPDGRLYLGLGDGGGAFDPRQTAQDPQRLLGKIIATRTTGPPDWDVVVYGLRNPWRFSFDPALGEIWIADVGQDFYEEVNRMLLEPDEPPKNAGWSAYEGLRVLDSGHRLDETGELKWPVAGYTHSDGCSITGGHVYAGVAVASMERRYVYGDYCFGTLWTLSGTPQGGATDVRRERAKVPQLTHIGVDADGELLFASGTGALYRAVATGGAR